MKRPAFQFYPADWLNDLSLRQCSPMARSLWMDAICLMHDGEPYGHLRTIGGDITLAFLARTSGLTVSQVGNCLAELEKFQVFSRNDAGTIYSRRMVRDERVREARAKGGSASLDNPNVPRPKRNATRTDARISLVGSFGGSPSSSSSSSSSKAGERSPLETEFSQTLAAAQARFPDTDSEMAEKIALAVRAVVPDASDFEISCCVSSCSARAKESSGYFILAAPKYIRKVRAASRDSPIETAEDALVKAREQWQRFGPEERAELEKYWPEGTFDEKHAS